MKKLLLVLASLSLAICVQAQPKKVRPNGAPPPPPPHHPPPPPPPPTYSFASNTQNEVVISPTRFSIESYKYSKSETAINAYAAYNYHLRENMQVGGEGGFLSVPGSSDLKTVVAAMGVFTWNFNANLREAFFAQGGVGLYPAYDKDNHDFDSKISFFAGGGKRFEMWGKLNYMPYLRIWKRGDEDSRIEIQALNFSIFY